MIIKHNIKPEDLAAVEAMLKIEKKRSVRDRLQAVSLYFKGMSKQDASKMLNKHKDFTGIWVQKYFEKGLDAFVETRGYGYQGYLSQIQQEELVHIINNSSPIEYKVWDGKLITDLIKVYFGKTYANGSIYSLLRKLKITHKIATKVDPKKSQEKIDKWKIDIKKI